MKTDQIVTSVVVDVGISMVDFPTGRNAFICSEHPDENSNRTLFSSSFVVQSDELSTAIAVSIYVERFPFLVEDDSFLKIDLIQTLAE
jgi:hypothetical protein